MRAALALTPPVVSPWAHKCFAVTSTPPARKPRTTAAAKAETKQGSSPKHSSLRPQRGSRRISRAEANAKSTPMSLSCRPQTFAASSSSAGDQDAAAARFTGSR